MLQSTEKLFVMLALIINWPSILPGGPESNGSENIVLVFHLTMSANHCSPLFSSNTILIFSQGGGLVSVVYPIVKREQSQVINTDSIQETPI